MVEIGMGFLLSGVAERIWSWHRKVIYVGSLYDSETSTLVFSKTARPLPWCMSCLPLIVSRYLIELLANLYKRDFGSDRPVVLLTRKWWRKLMESRLGKSAHTFPSLLTYIYLKSIYLSLWNWLEWWRRKHIKISTT